MFVFNLSNTYRMGKRKYIDRVSKFNSDTYD